MMKLVQKILSHGLLIAFLVAAFFVYSNRNELFPQWFAKAPAGSNVSSRQAVAEPQAAATDGPGVGGQTPRQLQAGGVKTPDVVTARSDVTETQVPQYRPKASDDAGVESGTGTRGSVEPLAAPGEEAAIATAPAGMQVTAAEPPATQQETSVAGTDTADVAEDVEVSDSTPVETVAPAEDSRFRPLESSNTGDNIAHEAGPVVPPAAAAESEIIEPARPYVPPEAAVEARPPVETVAVETPEPAVEPEPESTDAAPAIDVDAKIEAGLLEARRRYWQRDMRGASAAYDAVAKANPDNADVWGEIGNFYYSLRQRQPASQAYARAIELLINQQDSEHATRLLDVLFQLDADRARELAVRLQQAGG